jgi:phosphatidylglycerol:prolipoprotein diacylglycerol transferase
MFPILATIPPLPVMLLWPLAGLTLVLALFFTARGLSTSRVAVSSGATGESTGETSGDTFFPLLLGALFVFLLWVWSRNPIKLHSYGLLLVIGFAVAVWHACLEAKRRGHDPNIILDLSVPLLIWSVIACRVLFIILDPGQFRSLGDMIRIWDGGLSFHGSLVAAPIVIWYYARRNNIRFGELADVIAPSVFLGYAIARFGCLFNGCCYGGVCELPWAMRFHVDGRPNGLLTEPSHPAQLYSSLLSIGFFALMQRAKLSPTFNRFAGQLTLLFFALYAVERAIVEIFRNGATAGTVFGSSWMTQAQFASFVGLVVIAALWITLSRRSTVSHYWKTSRDKPQPPASSL